MWSPRTKWDTCPHSSLPARREGLEGALAGSVPLHCDESAFRLHSRSPAWEISPSVAPRQLFLSRRWWLWGGSTAKLTHICTVLFKIGRLGFVLIYNKLNSELQLARQLLLCCFSPFLSFALIFTNREPQILYLYFQNVRRHLKHWLYLMPPPEASTLSM